MSIRCAESQCRSQSLQSGGLLSTHVCSLPTPCSRAPLEVMYFIQDWYSNLEPYGVVALLIARSANENIDVVQWYTKPLRHRYERPPRTAYRNAKSNTSDNKKYPQYPCKRPNSKNKCSVLSPCLLDSPLSVELLSVLPSTQYSFVLDIRIDSLLSMRSSFKCIIFLLDFSSADFLLLLRAD